MVKTFTLLSLLLFAVLVCLDGWGVGAMLVVAPDRHQATSLSVSFDRLRFQQAPVLRAVGDNSQLLEIGRASRLIKPPTTSLKLKAISYNIRWRSGTELQQMVDLFRSDPQLGGAVLLALQEVDRNKKRTGNTNTAKLLADELGMHYAWAAPPPANPSEEEETGVELLSRYPLSDIRRLVLPHPGPGNRRRVALGATIYIAGTRLRVYSVHAETRIAVDKKLEQMKAVLEDLATFPQNTPAMILGDFNTWEPASVNKTFKLFEAAGFHTPFDHRATFCRHVFLIDIRLKLDWVWLRDVQAEASGIDREIDISDHWPLWIELDVQPKTKPSLSTAAVF